MGEQESLFLDLSILTQKVNVLSSTPTLTGAMKILDRIQTLQSHCSLFWNTVLLPFLTARCVSEWRWQFLLSLSLSLTLPLLFPCHMSHKPVDNWMAFPWLQWVPKRSSSYSCYLANQSCHPVTGSVLAKMISLVPYNKLNGKAIRILRFQREPYLPITSSYPCKSCSMAFYHPLSFWYSAWNGKDVLLLH